jgi:hypothetical protein
MKRVGDMLTDVAASLGIGGELRLARQMSAWQRLVEEHVPAATGATTLLGVNPPALLVSASSQAVAQELRLRQAELLAAFAQAPEGVRLLELRVSIRPVGRPPEPGGRSAGRR